MPDVADRLKSVRLGGIRREDISHAVSDIVSEFLKKS